MQTSIHHRMGAREWVVLLILALIWGGSFFFAKIAIQELAPFTIVFGRTLSGAILLNITVFASGQRLPVSPKTWGAFLVMGVLNNLIPFSLIFWSQTHITSGMASILNATTPLWTVLLAHFLTRDERLTVGKISGILLGVTGVITMIGWDIFLGQKNNLIAQLAVIGAAVSYACAGIFGRCFRGISALVTASGQVTCTAILSAPIAMLIDQPWRHAAPGGNTILAILGLGVICTALAYIIYFWLLAKCGASNLLLVTLLIPVSALLLGSTLLKEVISPSQFLGMGLIACGLVFIDGRLVNKVRL